MNRTASVLASAALEGRPSIAKRATEASQGSCSLSPLASVGVMADNDRFAAVAVPKTATTSLTELMEQVRPLNWPPL